MSKKSDNISHGKPSAGLNPLKASQPSDSAKIRTDVEETKSRLTALAEKWKGVNSVYGFLTDLWAALRIVAPDKKQQKGGNPSRYAAFDIGNGLIVTIRASAHNADAGNYTKDGNVNGDSNLSIVLQKRSRKNAFKPNDEVKLEEYVYVNSRIASVENPLSQIALSLVNYLTDGNYIDTTGVAIPHKSSIKESKTNKNMKKNTIKLNESQLRQIVAESVKKVLKEGTYATHYEPIKRTYKTVAELYNMWSSVRNDNGMYTDEGQRIMSALFNVLRTIEQIDSESMDDGEEGSPYDLEQGLY